MNKQKECKCIYCGRGLSDGVKLSNSDIIPDALTNKRIINRCVCEKEHNNKFSDIFESEVINNLAFLRNRLGLFGKNSHLPKYQAEYLFGDIRLTKSGVTDREDLFCTDVISGTRSGKPVKFGKLERLKKFSISKEKKIEEIDLANCIITENVTFKMHLFDDAALRLAAKVGYEWYCMKNEIQDYYKPIYKDVVDSILSGANLSENVEIVTNIELYEILNNIIDPAGHALAIVHSSDRNIYVLFSFFGLVIYKIKIRKALVDFNNRSNVNFYGIRSNGSVIENIIISLSTDYLNKNSQKREQAYSILRDYIMDSLRKIFDMQLFTLRNFRFVIDEIHEILHSKDDAEKYNRLIGYGSERRLAAIFVLYNLGKNRDQYNETLDFNSNLKKIFHVEEKIILDKNIDNIIKGLSKEAGFFNNVRSGIDIFMIAYKKECQ